MRIAKLFLFTCCLAAEALAGDRVWLIGGGPDVYGSQAQIELNTLWAKQVIERLPGERDIRIWFDDGDDPAPDVSEWQPPQDSARALLPLARVMDSHWPNGLIYRNHRIPGVAGSTRSDLLAQALSTEARLLSESDSVWLLFNGHGRFEADLNNTMELWGRSWLHVNELADLLDQVPARTKLRFLFTQCYSGAFAALARPDTNRCGFLAEAADREAEGCSAAIEAEDFEDYSTHFFAALAGRSRGGAALGRDPDRDQDGVVSPLEAHYHTLLTAGSSDIPRATSEVLLEQWQPWYRSLAARLVGGADNVYGELAGELMAGVGIKDKAAIARIRDSYKAQYQSLKKQRQGMLEGELRTVRESLEDELLRRWPELGYPYTLGFHRFLNQDLAPALAFLRAQQDYLQLVNLQAEYQVLEQQLLETERDIARLDKIDHLLQLGRGLALLRALGSEGLVERYDNLLRCESEPF